MIHLHETEPVPLKLDTDGTIRVGGTRVPLDTLVLAFHCGATAEEIADQFPSLDLSDVYAAIGYYLRHRSELDGYLEQRTQQADALRSQIESRFDSNGLRERLLARRKPV